MPKEAQQNLKKIVPFASPMNPVDVTAQFFNDLSLVPTFTDVMLSKGGYEVFGHQYQVLQSLLSHFLML